MKKIFTVIVFCLVSVVSFSQLNAQKIEDFAGYQTVFKLSMNYGEIRYINDQGFIYFGATDNRFEDSMASIYLGADKESAIATLKDLRDLKSSIGKETLIVKGANNKVTKIFNTRFNGLVFETEHVAGYSYALSFTKWDKAIDSINNFNK